MMRSDPSPRLYKYINHCKYIFEVCLVKFNLYIGEWSPDIVSDYTRVYIGLY